MKKSLSYDLHKCYTSCLLENERISFPVESVFDDIVERPLECGELTLGIQLPVGKAYIAREFYLGCAKYSLGFYPAFFVQYCLDQGAVGTDDITHIQKAARTLAGNTFRPLVEKLQAKFPTCWRSA